MNKTIIININGIVFHIEEDAYEILKNYMTDVKRHFSNSADSLEITTDIENRIAEMFSEILAKDNRQVIVDQDVHSVIEQMGSVADFENAEEDAKHESSSYGYTLETRRLFRDPDDHLVAGVCSGIANYFDIDAVWIRLAFAISFAFAGTGLILYIILWIIVPKAITRADRMSMKGEKQNLQGFKKNFEDELSSMKQNLSNFGTEARPFVYKARDFAGDFFHHLGKFIGGAGKVFVKILGVLILLAAFGFCVTLIVMLIAILGFKAGNPHAFFPFTIISNEHADNVYLCAFFAAFIPLLSIILITLKGIFNVGSIGKSTGTVFLVIWLCSLGMLAYYAVKISSNFREEATFTQTINLKTTKSNTYYIDLNDIKYFSHDDSVRLDIKDHFRNMVVIDDRYNDFHNEPNSVSLAIEKADVKYPELVEKYSAKGGNYEDALFNARSTSYVFAQQDSILKFDYSLRKRPGISWHDEEVELTLKVPLNSKVVIDHRMRNYLRNVDLYDCDQANKKDNPNTSTFMMTDNGLQCKVDTLVTAKKDSIKTDSALKKE
ncbi:PspC domain-containing protein [Mucilaginibacter gotjawali]|uniref:Phage shock protein PspC (Stress-responsive transcriptional regulator) n=1 Tax=Mucilaginibacter gotjawali TaxID=1550579 RepID=A0A839SH93_9SPHI|nr:PspC domain-containing protein [Mucilaginibacter gotjawali]MBB3056702.1 phage shock protein PspC (stress-responsive transcriptional regulator) [Mucilaginibacter gotjawali]